MKKVGEGLISAPGLNCYGLFAECEVPLAEGLEVPMLARSPLTTILNPHTALFPSPCCGTEVCESTPITLKFSGKAPTKNACGGS